MDRPSYAVVDVETTGLDAARCEVIDIAVVLTDHTGTAVRDWTSRVRPQGRVTATRVHGLTAADVADAPTFADLLPHLSTLLTGRIVVAHNASFDLRFLRAEYARAGWHLPDLPVICTRSASRVYLPHAASQRLPDCCAAVGVDHHHAHSALGDARATAGLLAAYLRSPDQGEALRWQQAWHRATTLHWPGRSAGPPAPPHTGTVPSRPRDIPPPPRTAHPGSQQPRANPTAQSPAAADPDARHPTPDVATIRAWARVNGWPDIGSRGRLPSAVVAAYRTAVAPNTTY